MYVPRRVPLIHISYFPYLTTIVENYECWCNLCSNPEHVPKRVPLTYHVTIVDTICITIRINLLCIHIDTHIPSFVYFTCMYPQKILLLFCISMCPVTHFISTSYHVPTPRNICIQTYREHTWSFSWQSLSLRNTTIAYKLNHSSWQYMYIYPLLTMGAY